MSDTLVRPLGDLLSLLLIRTPVSKEEPAIAMPAPQREFSDYLMAAAGAQGVALPVRPRSPVPPRSPARPPGRQPREKRPGQGRPESEPKPYLA